MTDTTTLIQRLRDMSAEHCGGSEYDRETSKTLDATIRTIEELEAHAKWHQEQYQILRARCDSLTARARVAEAEAKALRQRLQEEELN